MSASAEADAALPPKVNREARGRSGFRASQGKACNGRHRNLQQGIRRSDAYAAMVCKADPTLGGVPERTHQLPQATIPTWVRGWAPCFKVSGIGKCSSVNPGRPPPNGTRKLECGPVCKRRRRYQKGTLSVTDEQSASPTMSGYQALRSGASLVCSTNKERRRPLISKGAGVLKGSYITRWSPSLGRRAPGAAPTLPGVAKQPPGGLRVPHQSQHMRATGTARAPQSRMRWRP